MDSKNKIVELLKERESLLQYRRQIWAQIADLKNEFELTGKELVQLDSEIEKLK